MKIRLLIIIGIIIVAFVLPSSTFEKAYAICAEEEVNHDNSLKESELAFIGTVDRLENYDGPQRVTFIIHEVMKGEIDTPKYILENSRLVFLDNDMVGSSSIDVDYTIGKTYKVYVMNGDTNGCSTKEIYQTDYIWEPGPESGKYTSENPVWIDPCDEGYGLSNGVCITLEEMNRNAPPHLEPNQYPKGVPYPEPVPEQDILIYDDCGPDTILQDGICVVTSESKSTETNVKWGNPYEKFPPPNLYASCSSDGAITMWFYQFIVNPLCKIGIQIIPDYECNCNF